MRDIVSCRLILPRLHLLCVCGRHELFSKCPASCPNTWRDLPLLSWEECGQTTRRCRPCCRHRKVSPSPPPPSLKDAVISPAIIDHRRCLVIIGGRWKWRRGATVSGMPAERVDHFTLYTLPKTLLTRAFGRHSIALNICTALSAAWASAPHRPAGID